MHIVKKAAGHVRTVMKGMIFIGFSGQIIWGIVWMCCNFARVQDFGEPDGALYGGLFRLLGENPQVMYLVQILAAFFTGYFFLQKLRPAGRGLALWRGLALLTVPFAMQCHLAVQPYSLLGSLYMLLLLGLLAALRGKAARNLALAALCTAGTLALSGAWDGERRAEPGHSFEGAMASRFAWPTIWNDLPRYPEELQELTAEVAWEASFAPGNMELFYVAVESRVGEEAARRYYLQMAKVAWTYHAPMVVRQMGWDMLGYAVSPVVFQKQMAGGAYASYSARNYEVMRSCAPVVTRNYVDYGCWWFGSAVILAALLALAGLVREGDRQPGEGQNEVGGRQPGEGQNEVGGRQPGEGQNEAGGRQSLKGSAEAAERSGRSEAENQRGPEKPDDGGSRSDMTEGKLSGRKRVLFPGICIAVSGLLIALLVLRGAGQMDYRLVIAINQLWLCWPLTALGSGRQERI